MTDEERKTITVEIGTQSVVIDKLYGPTIFVGLRITPDIVRAEWLIERATGPENVWIEWCRIPGQMGLDFIDWDKGDASLPAAPDGDGTPTPPGG